MNFLVIRKKDIPLLINHFITKYNAEMGKSCTGVSDEVMRLLMSNEWKGNIREMQNVIERAVIFSEGDVIKLRDIGLIGQLTALSEEGDSLPSAVKVYEKEHILRVLNRHDWDKTAAAKAMGIGVSSLYRKIDKFEIKDRKEKYEN